MTAAERWDLISSAYDAEGIDISPYLLTPAPTRARPGSAAKVMVLMFRAANLQRLWHTDDAQDTLVSSPRSSGRR